MKTCINLSVADLKRVLPGLTKIIGKKSTLPILGCLKVSARPDNVIQLQATNLDEVAMVRLAAPAPLGPGEIIVAMDELNTVAKRCSPEDTIALQCIGSETILVYPAAGTRIEKSLGYFPLAEWPPCPVFEGEPTVLDESFKRAIKEAFECSSVDSSRYVLNGACLDVSKKEAHYVVATDGHHLYSANSFLFDIPQSLIVPTRKFLVWLGFMEDGPWRLSVQPEAKSKPALFRFDSEHWTYVAKSIEGHYPNWHQVVPDEAGPSRIVLGDEGALSILKALPLLPGADSRNHPVSLEMTSDALLLKAKASEQNEWTSIAIPAQVSGPAMTIAVDRNYLARALRFGLAEIALRDSLSPLVFTAKGKKMVVMPLRPDGPATPSTAPSPAVKPPGAAEASSPTPPFVEAVSADLPSPAESINPMTELERNASMPENTLAAPRRGNLTEHKPESSPMDEVMEQINKMRTSLREVLEDLTETERLLRKAVKEQKASDKEINRARLALRSLQSVEL